MKIRNRLSKSVKPGVKPAASRSKKVELVRTAAKKAVKKAARIVSGFYRQLRGTPLKAYNLRAVDFNGQAFTEAPTVTREMVVVLTGAQGVTMSVLPMKGTVAKLDKKRGFDVSQIKQAKVMTMADALNYVRRNGHSHVIRRGKHNTKGYTLGDMKQMYLGFVDPSRREITTLETRRIRDGRNKEHLFELVK